MFAFRFAYRRFSVASQRIHTALRRLTTTQTVHDDNTIGFSRKKEGSLVGTVKLYNRHIFAMIPLAPDQWESQVEESLHPLLKPLDVAINTVNEHPRELKNKLTVAYNPAIPRGSLELMVFPEAVLLKEITTKAQIIAIADQLSTTSPLWPQRFIGIRGENHIFICGHKTRDPRCGYCGPILLEEFKKHAPPDTFVWQCSHVGGHAFAGNVLVFPTGDWYGYVTPSDVPDILDAVQNKGEKIVERLWRGRMGMSEEAQKARVKHREAK